LEITMHIGRLWHVIVTAIVLPSASAVLVEPIQAAEPSSEARSAEVHVGIDGGDIRGHDQRALQAAVDYVAGLGGGTVFIELDATRCAMP
jgi:hypothetical protein